MSKDMLSGITVVGGVHVSNFVILMIAGVVGVGLVMGVNLLERKKKEAYYTNRPVVSYAAKAYQTDSNAHEVAQRVLTTIIANAGNREEIAENMDYISSKINEKMGTISSLVQQRRNGEITRQQFRAAIRQLIIQIMDELQMPLRPRPGPGPMPVPTPTPMPMPMPPVSGYPPQWPTQPANWPAEAGPWPTQPANWPTGPLPTTTPPAPGHNPLPPNYNPLPHNYSGILPANYNPLPAGFNPYPR